MRGFLLLLAALASAGCTGVLERVGADGTPVDAGPTVELLDGQAGLPPVTPGTDGGTSPPGRRFTIMLM